ncbi:MAG: MBL fold metallo-hydrolase [Dokdonia sp.]
MNLRFWKYLWALLLISCTDQAQTSKMHAGAQSEITTTNASATAHKQSLSPYISVLGIAQDGGFPHTNYHTEFEAVASGSKDRLNVVSLGLVAPKYGQHYLFEATPDLPEQLYALQQLDSSTAGLDGIFLTHAHIGHYTGLMFLGREVMGGHQIPVYAMPRMTSFLKTNGPWSQLVDLKNISLFPLQNKQAQQLNPELKVTPFIVPHRDEFSETVGYRIQGPTKTALFIPDIDKWEQWEESIVAQVQEVDYAFVDATFFQDGEIPRPMSEVPHPFISETVSLFAKADPATKAKIVFIHFNHSNPLLDKGHPERIQLEQEGFRFAQKGMRFAL